jgi:hypothetical protein
MFLSDDSFGYWEQLGELVSGVGRIPSASGPGCQALTGLQGYRVFRAESLFFFGK